MAKIGADIEAGVVDQDVDAAMRPRDIAEQSADILAARDIDRGGAGQSAGIGQISRRLECGFTVDVGEPDVSALDGEKARGGKADAGRRSRHQRDAPFEPCHGPIPVSKFYSAA